MSSTRQDKFSFGTQSPPCVDEEPMGVCSIRGDKPKSVPDREQRAGTYPNSLSNDLSLIRSIRNEDYFKNDWTEDPSATGGAATEGTEKVTTETWLSPPPKPDLYSLALLLVLIVP
ncbi:hypothetical protein LXA43DRAFT_1091987 [Ganoderma leucocontextum]|nr:hypothetical protein LXA43DRAFT_1091987 [Ganoderma leucocontextum]